MKAAYTPTIKRRGFTLLESLMAAALLSIAAASIVSPILATYQQQQYSEEQSRSASLARELMDEIACRPFVDPDQPGSGLGPDFGETSRALYDNIDDYNGYWDSTADLKTIDGASIESSYQNVYSRSVYFIYRVAPSPTATSGSGDFIQAVVNVTTPSGKTFKLERWFSKYDRK